MPLQESLQEVAHATGGSGTPLFELDEKVKDALDEAAKENQNEPPAELPAELPAPDETALAPFDVQVIGGSD